MSSMRALSRYSKICFCRAGLTLAFRIEELRFASENFLGEDCQHGGGEQPGSGFLAIEV